MPRVAIPAARLARHGALAARPAGRVRVGLPAGASCAWAPPASLLRADGGVLAPFLYATLPVRGSMRICSISMRQ